MKFRLKFIAVVILCLLLLVCGYQTYWLINFHNEQYNKLERVVQRMVEDSSLKEMAVRLTIISAEKDQGKYVPTVIDTINETQIVSQNRDETSFSMQLHNDTTDSSSSKNVDSIVKELNYVNVAIKRGLSMSINNIKGPDVNRFDSILRADLSAQGLNIPYVIEVRNDVTDSLIARVPDIDINYETSQKYSVEEWREDTRAYYLYLDNPKWYIFKDMWGLVTVSVLMIIMLIISYIYLLKVILRQKSIDEIKSDFINNMTHELKTPISVTYAAVDALQNFGLGDDAEKRDKYLTISKEQLMYLNSLVEQILTMSVEERKNLKLVPEDIELKRLFDTQEGKFMLNSAKPITFAIDVKPEILLIKADKLHFSNIVSNLIENAIKYSKDEVEIKLSASKSGNNTVISICDNGIGIPTGSLDKIFDKFYRVSTGNIHDVKGYGLGLFYVKTIVEKHGWNIKVESILGKGTCFKIIIP